MRRWLIIIALCGLGLLAAVAFMPQLSEQSERENSAAVPAPNADVPVTKIAEETPGTIQLPESGRLTIAYSDLPKRKALTLALPLAEGAIGDTPLPARIVDVEGRVLDVLVNPAPADPTGATLALDPEWLTPGSYMIQVRTQDQSALPLRRFVLIVE